MMSNNKILTVSYGTFSCTLEGFDDSFGTMKAIAEYFRDLAADDRYFGAEPPQPDAEMLARIAQKEISRRVEARQHDGRIVLSAMQDTVQTAPAPLSAAAPAAMAAAAVSAQEETADLIAEDAPASAPQPSVPEAPHAESENMAQKVAETADTAEATPDAAAEPIVVAEQAPVAAAEAPVAIEPMSDVAQETTVAVEDVPEAEIVPGQPDADVEAFFAETRDTALAEDDEPEAAPIEARTMDDDAAADVIESPAPPDNSIAAKLQRIRAVVAQHSSSEDYAEDEEAEAPVATQSDAAWTVDEARADIEDALQADAVADLYAEEEEDDSDDISAILNRLGSDAPEAVSDAEDDQADEGETSATDDATADTMVDDGDDTEEMPATASGVAQVSAGSDDLRIVPRARVIKVKRADLEAAIESGDLEEYDGADAPEVSAAQSSVLGRQSTLSAEQEDELTRELAALEADMDEGEDGDDLSLMDADSDLDGDDKGAGEDSIFFESAEDDSIFAEDDSDELTPAHAGPTRPARSVLPSIDDERDTSVTRLMAETKQQMDEPESATRRDAFSHLRAAVAAKKADEAMSPSRDDGRDEDNAYRNDLADVVRPRRPVSSGERSARPEEARPAPLKLVAAQRIDVDRPRTAGPVRPRRVAAVEDPVQSAEGESFADFAAEMGATKLPQLLEAAAAYMSFVEGREQFSRPQLMSKVRQAGPENGFSREDGLRSFGQLLRAGKIEKIKGGRFTVSDDIGFRPDHRAAG